MGGFSEIIASTGMFSRGYAQLLLKDVKPEIFARKPRFVTATGVTIVDTNHPAFVFGHLGLYPSRVFSLTGGDPKPFEAPAGWNDLFKAGAECRDDAEGKIYPRMEEITAHFFRAHEAAANHLRTVDDAKLLAANPNEAMRERFPTVGALLSFVMSAHVMSHMGQISAWRRCFGLSSAMG